MGINPIEIKGNWDKGIALDRHVFSSTPKGENVYGHMEYDTIRTELGELLFQFKYRNKYDCINDIMDMIIPFLENWEELRSVDVVLSAPPSKTRVYQPASVLAQAIAEHLDISFSDEILVKTTSEQSKNMTKSDKHIKGSIIAQKKAKRPHTVLLVDDLYSTGETLSECVSILREDPLLRNIYVLVMTKTRG